MSDFDHFLARVHRRWMVLRAIEKIALCMLIASVVSIVLATILITRGQDAISLVMICFETGASCGLIIGWLTRPSLFDAAVEVDRQLKLSDLLATALSVRRAQTMVADSVDTQWSATILSIAESRCKSLAGEPLMLRRLGVRAWGGVGICVTMALTLGVLSTNPLISQAGSAARDRRESETEPFTTPPTIARFDSTGGIEQRPSQPSGGRPDFDSESRSDAKAQSADGRSSSNSAAVADGAGSGAGRTADATQDVPPLLGASDAASSPNGESSSGGGRAALDARAGETDSSIAADGPRNRSAPPWTHADWNLSQQRAAEQLRTQQVPDAYRDLVRDYFNR